MNIRQCYKVLGVRAGADMEEVKAAFRRRAFELHPDLHPGDADAKARFQQLNEAYVLLKEALVNEPPPSRKKTRKKNDAPTAGKAEGARRYERQSQAAPETDAPGAKTSGAKRPKTEASADPRFTFKKEDVFENSLSDPFARKVFEDIYSQIRRKGAAAEHVPQQIKNRSLSLRWGEKVMRLDLSRGFFGGIRHWMRKQMDDEQIVRLAPSQLLPGNIVRLTIRRAWGGEPVTVEVPIPADYVVGRPLRLRGLGRKLGPVKGDLYLRLMAG